MITLALETSTNVCSVALCANGLTLAYLEVFEQNAHAATLTPLIEQLLAQANGVTMNDIEAVAVSSGPGSYTGLRIGVSTAKGICYADGKKLIAVPTLALVAQGIFMSNPDAQFAAPMLDARRMEVYTALFSRDGRQLMPDQPMIVDETSFGNELANKQIYFGGNGSAKCRSIITNENARFADDIFPLAANMAALIEKRITDNKFEDVAYFEPFYLKDFIATTPKHKVI